MTEDTKQRGQFIVIEGIDGAGKSTHAKAICDYIESHFVDEGKRCIPTREPGGSPIGKMLRETLLNPSGDMDPMAELLLLYGERVQHVKRVITPALEQGNWVVCERFVGSSYAYQGGGKKVDSTVIESLTRLVTEKAELTLFLDIPVELAKDRMQERGQTDRFEREKVEFFENVRQAFLVLSEMDSKWKRVDADQEQGKVWADIQHVLDERFARFKR